MSESVARIFSGYSEKSADFANSFPKSKSPDILTITMGCIGQVAALDMQSGDCIQGRIKHVFSDSRIVVMERPFINGRPMNEKEKSFPLKDIIRLRVLDVKAKTKEEQMSRNSLQTASTNDDAGGGSGGAAAVASGASDKISRILDEISPHLKDCSPKVPLIKSAPFKIPESAAIAAQENLINAKIEPAEATTSHVINSDGNGISNFNIIGNDKTCNFSKQHNSSPCTPTSDSTTDSSQSFVKYDTRFSDRRGIHSSYRYGSERKSHIKLNHASRRKWIRGHSGKWGLEQNIRVSKHNEGLTKPIDFNLDEDFDFEKNFEIFRDQEKRDKEVDRRDVHALESQFSRMNYEHFENVISDPKRVTSWTTNRFIATVFETTIDGHKLPFMKLGEKEKFLQRAEPYLGSDLFHVMIADRLLMFIWKVMDRFEIMVNQIVVLDSAAVNSFMTTMFLRHISNRACKTIVYSCIIGQYNLPHIKQVHDVNDLPKTDVQIIVVLGPVLLGDVREWVKKMSPPAHIICIEKRQELSRNEHIMMVGVGTILDDSQKKKHNPEILRGVVDIGVPFTWMDSDSAACLSSAFATQSVVLC